MKALVGAFNQEKALVGAFSVIVKTDCGTDGSFYSTNSNPCQPPGPGPRAGESNVTVTHAPWLSCSIHPASKYTKYGNIVTDCDGVRLDCVMANIGGQ